MFLWGSKNLINNGIEWGQVGVVFRSETAVTKDLGVVQGERFVAVCNPKEGIFNSRLK